MRVHPEFMIAIRVLVLVAAMVVAAPSNAMTTCSADAEGIDDFMATAKSLTPTTDKVTAHKYQTMYAVVWHS